MVYKVRPDCTKMVLVVSHPLLASMLKKPLMTKQGQPTNQDYKLIFFKLIRSKVGSRPLLASKMLKNTLFVPVNKLGQPTSQNHREVASFGFQR